MSWGSWSQPRNFFDLDFYSQSVSVGAISNHLVPAHSGTLVARRRAPTPLVGMWAAMDTHAIPGVIAAEAAKWAAIFALTLVWAACRKFKGAHWRQRAR